MDYATDIEFDEPDRHRHRGGLSFLVVLIGTACLVAAWILSAGDPYGDLAHGVVEVRTSEGERTLQPGAEQGPIGLLPDVVPPEIDNRTATLSDDEAFRHAIGSLPRAGGSHPAEFGRGPASLSAATRAPGGEALPSSSRLTVPVEEFATPLPDADDAEDGAEVELTRAQRQSVQRRLGMAGHNAGGTDGVFGPRTREAIAAYQESSDLPASGLMDRATLEALRAETDADYVAWAESHGSGTGRRTWRYRGSAANSSDASGACPRDAQGNITGGGVGCRLRGMNDNMRDAFGDGFQSGADR